MVDTIALLLSHGMLVLLIIRLVKTPDPSMAKEQKTREKAPPRA